MIAYKLKCADGHEFEGWFSSSAAFDEQIAAGLVGCPFCGANKVEKAVMAPAISGGTKKKLTNEESKKVRQYVAGLRKYVLEHGENVGKDFPEEVRKIHYGDAEERQIYGEATLKEALELTKEGIDIAPLPSDPDDKN